MQTPFVRFCPHIKFTLDISVPVSLNVKNDEKKKQLCNILMCEHCLQGLSKHKAYPWLNCTEWSNKCNPCKNLLKLSTWATIRAAGQHKVNYVCANTICKLCPHIKIAPWHNCKKNEWSATWNDIGRNHHKHIAVQHASMQTFFRNCCLKLT